MQSHYENNNEKFTSIAKEIKDFVVWSKTVGFKVIKINPDLSDLVLVYYSGNKLTNTFWWNFK